jgi:hypothetical protein
MHPLLAWLGAFAFSQAIEMPIYALALRCVGLGRGRLWLAAFGPTALTHPIVWFVFPWILPTPYWLMGVAAESFAVLAEALYLHFFGVRRALVWSLTSNALSCGVGLAARATLGWP